MKQLTKLFAQTFFSRLSTRARQRAKTRLRPHLKIESLEERRVLAREIGMLNDLQFFDAQRGSQILLTDQLLYFTRNSPELGTELWVYDDFFPSPVADIWPGYQSSNPHDLVMLNGQLFFVANDGLSGDELWKKSNPGPFGGAQLVADILPGPLSSGIDNLTVAGPNLFFTANNGTSGTELWKFDGFSATLMRDIAPGLASSSPENLVAIGSQLLFTADDGINGRELWTSNGTAGGTFLVANLRAGANGASPKYLTNVSGALFFAADSDGNGSNELWRTDAFSTQQISQTFPVPSSVDSPKQLFNYNGTLMFVANSAAAGNELWKLDGSGIATLVKDVVAGTASSSPVSFTEAGGLLYFIANTSPNPTLWKSDGTTAGTLDMGTTIQPFNPLANVGGLLYFGRSNELKSTNGFGFNSVTEFTAPGRVDKIVSYRGQPFFTDVGFLGDLWFVGGVLGRQSTDTNRYTGSANTNELVESNGSLFVDADYFGGSGIARIDPGSLENEYFLVHADHPRGLTNVGGNLYYFAGRELFVKSGASITQLMSMASASTTGLRELVNVNGTVYFSSTDGFATGLFKTNGTVAGTTMVKNFPSGTAAPRSLVNVNGALYFVANDGSSGIELWKSDGTTAGTVLISNIAAGIASSNPDQLMNIGSTLYFSADNGSTGMELWRSDGTSAGTVLVRNIAANATSSNPTNLKNVGGVLYFSADDGIAGRELWKSDGTTAGTQLVRDIRSGTAGSNPTELTDVAGKLFFAANDGTNGVELWSSTGTSAGTTPVSSIVAGATGSYPTRLTNFGGVLYFTPEIRPVGQRLWKSDGSSSGTQEVLNAANRGSPQVASKLQAANGKLFFTGRTDQFGTELFVLGDADFGDAAGAWTSASFGAANFANGPMLGTLRDTTETEGVPSALANSDDLGGIDDEDGLNAPMVGTVGGTISVSLTVSNATSLTTLSAYLDFDQDNRFDDGIERVAYLRPVVNGVNTFSFNVPTTAKLGTSTARFRVTENQNTFGSGLALSGETEDHLFTLERSSTVTLPTTGANDIVIRKAGSNVEVVNRITSAILFTDSLASLSRLTIVGADTQSDTVLVDYVSGGFFSLVSGLEINGQGGADTLTINGSGTTQAVYALASGSRPQLTFTQAAQTSAVIYTSFETQTFNGLQSFLTSSSFDVGANVITINSVDPVSLANPVSLAGGSLTATALTLAATQTLSGFGSVSGNFSGLTSSNIQLSGNLSIGNATSTSGFATLGTINTQGNTLTLLDANDARLGSSTILGNGASPGRIVAAKGLQVSGGNQVTGFGTIDTPADINFAFLNNGTLIGTSVTNRLTTTGYVTGTGVLNRVTVAGTVSPGSNLINVNYGEVNYAGTLVMEVGGTTAGTGYDQINHSGAATLAGTLDLRLVNSFVPSVGTQWTLINATGGITGRFTNLLLPPAPGGLQWDVGYTSTTVKLQLAALALTITGSSISENGGSTTATVTRNSYDLSQSLTINLASSDTTEATVPATVTIPAGQASASFTISAVDDALLDGSQVVSISVAATGFAPDSKSLTVTDFETLSVSIAPDSISEKSGVATGTVTRNNTDVDAAITVTLTSNDTTEATVPSTVTIPAGQASATFAITAVDDTLLDGSQTVQITATRVGYANGLSSLTVTDSENLTVSIDVASISEAGGLTLGRVTRSNTDISNPIVVTLLSSDTTEATVPDTVVIPANQLVANFLITAVDDTLLDGTQTVTISASMAAYIGDSKTIDVTDSELLSVTVNATSMSENGGSITGTVTRSNTDIAADLTVTLTSSDTSEATVPATITIPAGQAATTFTITAVDDTILDGTQRATITASSSGYQSGTRFVDVLDSETLTLVIQPNAISEKGGTATGTVTRSNTDIASSVTVNLSSSDTTEASLPNVVTIPAGQASASFTITAVDDNLLDGTQTAQISVSGSGYLSGSQPLSVLDFEQLLLAINLSAISEKNGTAIGTVSRPNTNNSSPLTVNLLSNDTSEATVPATVVIPANQSSATFTITAIDDSLQDGTQTANISVSAVGYVDDTKPIDIMDSVALSLTVDAAQISENAGSTTATVARSNLNIESPLTVTISSSDTTEASVPATVTIPANQASVSFTISAVDDALLDGPQVVTINISASGYSPASKNLIVTDYEQLQLTIDAASISEKGGVTTGRIVRNNSDLAQAITVSLAFDDTSEAIVPNLVTIPANQTSASFTITAVDDNLLDGTQAIVLTASALGYVSTSSGLNVTDSEALSLTIDQTSISENGGTSTATITRSNTDVSGPLTVQVLSGDTTELATPASVTIPAGQSSATFSMAAVDDDLLDGTQIVSVTASASGYEPAAATLSISDWEELELSFAQPAIISENGGTLEATIRRKNSDLGSALTVTLTSLDTTEVTVPASVTIPAGQSSATFSMAAVDDDLLDGTQIVSVTASASGYEPAAATLSISDWEELELSFAQPAIISENGGMLEATIRRKNSDLGSALTVTLTSLDTTEVTVPASVTIPAGQASISFSVTAVDDALLDGVQVVQISAAATGYRAAQAELQVQDSETLSLSIDTSAISEAGGQARGTVTRSNTDQASPLVVTLTNSDTSELSLPASVTIPVGQASAQFDIQSIDDTLLDGSQTVQLSVSASGYVGSQASLDVLDSESLTLTLDQSSIEETGTTNARVSRSNSDTESPLVVTLSSSDPSAAIVPLTVTIPANQSFVIFSIAGNDDALLDGTQSTNITATASGYASDTETLQITDVELLFLSFDSTSLSEKNGVVQGTVRRGNTDVNSPLTIEVTNSDSSELALPATVTIPAGQASATFTAQAVDDDLLDGLQTVTITVRSSGYLQTQETIEVTDSESLTLTLSAATMSENAGKVRATLTRSTTDNSSPLTVQIQNADSSEVTVPTTVTVPANQSSVEFDVVAVDDGNFDGDQSVKLTATAVGYIESFQSVLVTDFVVLTLVIDADQINENGGITTGTLTRSNSDIGSPLVVQVDSSDPTQLAVPVEVTIPANSSSVSFEIRAIDNALLDATRSVSVTVEASGYQPGSDLLDVTDHESLSLTLDVSTFSEKNGRAVGTIARSNSDVEFPLVVTLQNSDSSEASVPSSVTIPAGQSSVTFAIDSVNDLLIDGAQTVVLTVSALGYIEATRSLEVLDDDRQFPWQSPRNPLDVNDSGQVTALDALLVINGINIRQVLTPQLPDPFIPVAYVDVNGDGVLSAIDALLVINELNNPTSGEGELGVAESWTVDATSSAPSPDNDWTDWQKRLSRRALAPGSIN